MSTATEPTTERPFIQLTEDELQAALQGGRAVFQLMDETGDSKKIWNPDVPDEVEDAKESFKRLKKAGYAFFHVDAKGNQGEQMNEFAPRSGRYIAVKALAGG